MTKLFTKDMLNPMRRFEKVFPTKHGKKGGLSAYEVHFNHQNKHAYVVELGKGFKKEFNNFGDAEDFIRKILGWGYEEITPEREKQIRDNKNKIEKISKWLGEAEDLNKSLNALGIATEDGLGVLIKLNEATLDSLVTGDHTKLHEVIKQVNEAARVQKKEVQGT